MIDHKTGLPVNREAAIQRIMRERSSDRGYAEYIFGVCEQKTGRGNVRNTLGEARALCDTLQGQCRKKKLSAFRCYGCGLFHIGGKVRYER